MAHTPHPSPLARAGAAACALARPVVLAGCAAGGPTPEAPSGGGAGAPASATSLTAGLEPDQVVAAGELTEAQADALTDFSLTLFNEAYAAQGGQGGALLSPVSVEYALAMTANGARGDTLAQMEDVLGLPVSDLNEALHAFAATLGPDAEGAADAADGDAAGGDADGEAAGPALRLADSVWIREGLAVERPFLQDCVNYYDAAIFQEPFDGSTADAINGWVDENTDGMIDRIVDVVGPQSMMYLVNAVAFDGAWETPYEESQVADDTFTRGDGTAQTLPLMASSEGLYLEGAGATGFIKPYADGRYALAALLPAEGTTPGELLASLSGSELRGLLRDASFDEVRAFMPKFEDSCGIELSGVLAAMGMPDAFGDGADFTGISADGGLCISEVNHRAFAAVDESGTRAAAATSVGIRVTSARPSAEPKEVRLDRPFAYLIIDNETNVPVFIGIMDGME